MTTETTETITIAVRRNCAKCKGKGSLPQEPSTQGADAIVCSDCHGDCFVEFNMELSDVFSLLLIAYIDRIAA